MEEAKMSFLKKIFSLFPQWAQGNSTIEFTLQTQFKICLSVLLSIKTAAKRAISVSVLEEMTFIKYLSTQV